jgi:hypothetical protein
MKRLRESIDYRGFTGKVPFHERTPLSMHDHEAAKNRHNDLRRQTGTECGSASSAPCRRAQIIHFYFQS